MDPDQLASEKPADLDLHCFEDSIYTQQKKKTHHLEMFNSREDQK